MRALFEVVCIVPGSVPGPASFRPGRQNGQGLRSRAPAGRGKYQKQIPANTHSQRKKYRNTKRGPPQGQEQCVEVNLNNKQP